LLLHEGARYHTSASPQAFLAAQSARITAEPLPSYATVLCLFGLYGEESALEIKPAPPSFSKSNLNIYSSPMHVAVKQINLT
jgi:hypothetical protein